MAANLTPQYRKAEDAYRQATSPEDELRCLQEMLRELPKHKGTDRLHAELKQKISRAKKDADAARSAGKRSTTVRIPRQGAGRVVIVGGPNAGKSQLLSQLTRATPEIADYPFTTRESLPGMMDWRGYVIQIIDTPPIAQASMDPSLQGLIRGADLALFVVDVGHDEGLDFACEALSRLHTTKTRLAEQSSLDSEDLGRSYTQTVLVYNQIDRDDSDIRCEFLEQTWTEAMKLQLPKMKISATRGDGLETLKDEIVRRLQLIRVFTKHPQEKEPDLTSPFTVRQGATLREVAELIHHDLAARLKGARVWNAQCVQPSLVMSDYEVQDGDIVELHAK